MNQNQKIDIKELICGCIYICDDDQHQKLIEDLFRSKCLLYVVSKTEVLVWVTKKQLFILNQYVQATFINCKTSKRSKHDDQLHTAVNLQLAHQNGLSFENNILYKQNQLTTTQYSLKIDLNAEIINYKNTEIPSIIQKQKHCGLFDQLRNQQYTTQKLDFHSTKQLKFKTIEFFSQNELLQKIESETNEYKIPEIPLQENQLESSVLKSILGSSKKSLSVSFSESVHVLESNQFEQLDDLEKANRVLVTEEGVMGYGRDHCEMVFGKFIGELLKLSK